MNAFWGGDQTSPVGVDQNSVHATSFPSPLAASLAWDPALQRRATDAISDEARGFLDPSLYGKSQNNLGPDAGMYGSLFYFSPTVNLDRDPRWGRVDETYGEDPFLTGTLERRNPLQRVATEWQPTLHHQSRVHRSLLRAIRARRRV